MIYLIPIISAFVGWMTNVIAIILLFRPRNKILGIQGLLPKYKDEVARRIGKGIKEYLLDKKALTNLFEEHISSQKLLSLVLKEIKNPIYKFIIEKILFPLLEKKIEKYVETLIKKLPDIIEIDKLVEERIKSLDLAEIEKIFYRVSGPEIRFIKLTGALIGFLVGLVQIIILKLKLLP